MFQFIMLILFLGGYIWFRRRTEHLEVWSNPVFVLLFVILFIILCGVTRAFGSYMDDIFNTNTSSLF